MKVIVIIYMQLKNTSLLVITIEKIICLLIILVSNIAFAFYKLIVKCRYLQNSRVQSRPTCHRVALKLCLSKSALPSQRLLI